MKTSITIKNTYWAFTGFIFLFEVAMPALTGHTEFAMEGIRHLGYPDYFGSMLVVYKVLGSLAILLPIIPHRIKEWAYAGLGFTTISAFISKWAVDGLTPALLLPFVFFVIITVSYLTYQKFKTVNSINHRVVNQKKNILIGFRKLKAGPICGAIIGYKDLLFHPEGCFFKMGGFCHLWKR